MPAFELVVDRADLLAEQPARGTAVDDIELCVDGKITWSRAQVAQVGGTVAPGGVARPTAWHAERDVATTERRRGPGPASTDER